jgi:RNA polymerase sigma factor (sigma-70 family)
MPGDPKTSDPAHALLRRWQEQGDRDALDELLRLEVATLADRLRRRGDPLLGASTSASDLAQEAVARMLARATPPKFEEPAQLRAYLWTAAWRLLLNRVQGASRRVTRLSSHGSESQSLADVMATSDGLAGVLKKEQSVAVDVALELLAPDDAKILELVYFEGLPIADVAEQLGIARGAADMRLTRARRKLATKLVEWNDVIG